MNEMIPTDKNALNEDKRLPGMEDKINEYAQRIQGGEKAEEVLKGIGPNFKQAVEDKLRTPEEAEAETETENINAPDTDLESLEEVAIPAQYEGMDAESVEFIWTIPQYLDEKKTASEHERKRKVLEILRQREAEASEKEEETVSHAEAIEEARQDIGVSEAPAIEANEKNEKDEYSTFKVSNGETDAGFYWYQYRNEKAKELKKSGAFEWGKERIYFDVAIADCNLLKELAFSVAAEKKIALSFKHIDDAKTFAAHKDGAETRFVANFASSDDARKFYDALKQKPEYHQLQADRALDYMGIRLDPMAEYASGFREKRGGLERIMAAVKNNSGGYEYASESGKKITISEEEYEGFKKQYDKMKEELEEEKKTWGK